MPLLVVLPELDDDLWIKKALSAIILTLGTSIGVQRLGKLHDKSLALVGVIVTHEFSFPDTIDITVEDGHGTRTNRMINIAYPCKPYHCEDCKGFGHKECGSRTWAVIAARPAPMMMIRTE